MADLTEETLTNQKILQYIDVILIRQNKMQEKLDCILHAVCKSDDIETKKAINKYLTSGYRNG